MNVAVVGGGITGLTAAYELTKAKHTVTVFEKESYLGGLAYGFKEKNWDWSLEYAYHHLFTNDQAILDLAHELGLGSKLITKRPITASLYNDRMYQMDSALTLLRFPGLPFVDRIRTGLFIAALKYNPSWQPLEAITAQWLATTFGGSAGWKAIWEPLMTGKFGSYADQIAASWLWARIVKRTSSLVYFDGGFNTFITTLTQKSGTIKTNTTISTIQPSSNEIIIHSGKKHEKFDAVILTIPTPLAVKLVPELISSLTEALTIPHLHAQVMILETDVPILNDIYWLNITDRSFPFLAVVAHTNFMDTRHYGGKHLTYIGNYLPHNHPFLKKTKNQLLTLFFPYIQKLNPAIILSQLTSYTPKLFTGPFAQPVHQIHYSKKAPPMVTPIPNLYLANMDSIYPWDRGTNYAVELGQKVATLLIK